MFEGAHRGDGRTQSCPVTFGVGPSLHPILASCLGSLSISVDTPRPSPRVHASLDSDSFQIILITHTLAQASDLKVLFSSSTCDMIPD